MFEHICHFECMMEWDGKERRGEEWKIRDRKGMGKEEKINGRRGERREEVRD